jgi:hypothetical protein
MQRQYSHTKHIHTSTNTSICTSPYTLFIHKSIHKSRRPNTIVIHPQAVGHKLLHGTHLSRHSNSIVSTIWNSSITKLILCVKNNTFIKGYKKTYPEVVPHRHLGSSIGTVNSKSIVGPTLGRSLPITAIGDLARIVHTHEVP